MSTVDYDAPRILDTDLGAQSLELLREERANGAGLLDADAAEDFELPGFEIFDEELTAPVIPLRADEFRCGGCFLVLHRGLRSGRRDGVEVCRDCA